jgi:DNA-binding transcriptional LysR family regulator
MVTVAASRAILPISSIPPKDYVYNRESDALGSNPCIAGSEGTAVASEPVQLTELSLPRLRIFAAIVEQGGYSAAADYLGLSQSTVSFHVRELQRALGTPLLVYRARQVHLTAAGQALYGLARRALRDAEEMADHIAELRAGRAGRVRLGAGIAFEQEFFFEQVVAPFQRAHPTVELSLHFARRTRIIEAVQAREVDLGYMVPWRLPADLRYEPLHGSQVVFFVAKDHPLASDPCPSIEDVARTGLITPTPDSTERQYYGALLRQAGLRGYRVALEVDGTHGRILAAQAGLGVLALFWPAYARHVGLPGLRPVSLPAAPTGPEFGLISRDEEPTAPVVIAFADWLRQVAGG